VHIRPVDSLNQHCDYNERTYLLQSEVILSALRCLYLNRPTVHKSSWIFHKEKKMHCTRVFLDPATYTCIQGYCGHIVIQNS